MVSKTGHVFTLRCHCSSLSHHHCVYGYTRAAQHIYKPAYYSAGVFTAHCHSQFSYLFLPSNKEQQMIYFFVCVTKVQCGDFGTIKHWCMIINRWNIKLWHFFNVPFILLTAELLQSQAVLFKLYILWFSQCSSALHRLHWRSSCFHSAPVCLSCLRVSDLLCLRCLWRCVPQSIRCGWKLQHNDTLWWQKGAEGMCNDLRQTQQECMRHISLDNQIPAVVSALMLPAEGTVNEQHIHMTVE